MRRALVLLAGLALAFTGIACQGNVFQLKVGDCFNGAATGTVTDVSNVDCATPHDAEVYFIFDYPNPPSDYPGTATVQTTSEDGCKPPFATFVGVDFDNSIYGLSYLSPTSNSWATGDRKIQCLVTPESGATKLTGSVKGAKK
jgi:hypothetical protein